MLKTIYFKKISDLYPICMQGGFQGSYDDFLMLNIGQVFTYISIVVSGDYTVH